VADALMVPADPERIVSAFLREQPELADALGDRIYTTMPKDKTYPLMVLTRWGGEVPPGGPLSVEAADVQFDVWADRKKQAQDVAQLVRAILAQRLPAGDSTGGWITGAASSAMRYAPDELVDPPRPRYVFSARLTCRSVALPAP